MFYSEMRMICRSLAAKTENIQDHTSADKEMGTMKNNRCCGAVKLSESIEQDIERMQMEVVELVKAICTIPAPSHYEGRRAAFVRDWFENHGIDAQIDEALNVYCEWGLEAHEDIVVVMAHMDTVFPDTDTMEVCEKDGKVYGPGIGDNATNLAAMMCLAAYLKSNGYQPNCGIVFVADSCEEGLGNLKGCKAIMKAYGERVKAFVCMDSTSESVCVRAVGSSRYKITVETEGGHSFADFGRRNAIEAIAKIVGDLYWQEVPQEEGCITTFNVGRISGGTSVNTIAQKAEMLYEYRSDSAKCLTVMEAQMREILLAHRSRDARISVKRLGERPGMGEVNQEMQSMLEESACAALAHYTGVIPPLRSGSTDCNVPLSMGVPSVCFGVYRGEGAHTREEWIDPESICSGMKAALSLLIYWFEQKK